MNGFLFTIRPRIAATLSFVVLALGVFLFCPVFSGAAPAKGSDDKTPGLDRAVSGQIECITPDGRLTSVLNSSAHQANAPALLTADNTINCHLQEGDTVFIIPFPKAALLDRFTFINQNAAASGEFNIAISDSRLPSNSPKWTQVDGIVPFSHKRLFNLSLLGTEAKYVKLSFHVEKTSRITRGFNPADAERARIAAEAPPPAAGPADD